MTLTQLEYVLALNRTRHFARAAEELHITQPTLSMQLKKLEEGLNVIIFDRSKSPLIPTPQGERLIEHAHQVMHHVRLLRESLGGEQELSGKFLVGIIPSLSPYLLPRFLKHFTAAYPNVELVIEEIQTNALLAKLKDDQLDAGLLATPLYDDGILERALFYEEYVAYLSPKHPLLKHKSLKREDLLTSNIWLLEDGHCMRHQVLALCSRKQRSHNVHFSGGSLETIKNLVGQGNDMTVLPKLATRELDQKLLRPIEGKRPMREISLVASRTFLKERYLDGLEKIILAHLPNDVHSLKNRQFSVLDPLS